MYPGDKYRSLFELLIQSNDKFQPNVFDDVIDGKTCETGPFQNFIIIAENRGAAYVRLIAQLQSDSTVHGTEMTALLNRTNYNSPRRLCRQGISKFHKVCATCIQNVAAEKGGNVTYLGNEGVLVALG